MVERDFLIQLAERNPAVREGLWRLRQRAYLTAGVPERERAPSRRSFRYRRLELRFPGDGLLFAALISFFVTAAGLAAMKLVWPGLSRGVGIFDLLALAGGVATWLLARCRDRLSVSPVEAPDAEASEPLLELQDLAERSAHRLKQGYRAQMTLAVAVMALLGLLTLWAAVVAVVGHPRFGVLLGGSALLTASLVGFNWHPFQRAREVRRLASEADLAAARLGLRLAAVEQIRDEDDRRHHAWCVVARSLVGLAKP